MSAPRLRGLSATSVRDLPGVRTPHDELVVLAELAEAQWGFAGVGCYGRSGRGYELRGCLLLAPAVAVESPLPFAADAAVLVELWTAPGVSVRRTSKDLVRSAAARLIRAPRQMGAIEAAPAARLPSASMALLGEVGFAPTDREPVLRLELHATVRWLPTLAELRERVSAWVTPVPVEPVRRQQLDQSLR